jgi:DNA-binding CsgD family transcriptional regulator
MVLSGHLGRAPASTAPDAPSNRFSPREREIVKLVAESKSNKKLANVLNISVKSVESQQAHIMEKLDLHSVTELVGYAIRNNIVEY